MCCPRAGYRLVGKERKIGENRAEKLQKQRLKIVEGDGCGVRLQLRDTLYTTALLNQGKPFK